MADEENQRAESDQGEQQTHCHADVGQLRIRAVGDGEQNDDAIDLLRKSWFEQTRREADVRNNHLKRFYWTKYRDLPYLVLVDLGAHKYQLWMSGKVTKETAGRIPQENKKPLPFMLREEHSILETVEPPFEFLQ